MAAACALPAVAAGQGAVENRLDWSLDLGVQHSDNITRTETDEESETLGIAGVTLNIDSERPRLDTDIAANLQYREYLDDTFESEVVGGLDGEVVYSFVPQRFLWTVQDNYGQIANQRQLVETPDNRQNVNYFSTGPDLIFRLGSRMDLQLTARYEDAYFENQPTDSTTLLGSLALIRPLSDTTSMSLNGSTSSTEFEEDELFADYDIDEAFVRVEAEGARTTLSADVGYTVVDQAGEETDGLLLRLDVSRRVATRSRLGLQAGVESTGGAESFRRDQQLTGVEPGNEDLIAAGDTYRSEYLYLLFNTDWERGAFAAVLSGRQEAHETATILDRDVYGARVDFSRQLTRRIDADLRAGYSDEEFVNQDFQFDEWFIGAGFTWQLTEQVYLRLRLDHVTGSSDDGSRDYEENRGYIGIAWSRRSR
jgi:hypothetical protein